MTNRSLAPARFLPTTLFALLLLLTACSDGNNAPAQIIVRGNAAAATVTLASGGNGMPLTFGHAAFDLADVGYEQLEFFIEGTADAYASAEPLTADGKWAVTPISPTYYKTRIVVNRPIDPAKFNGTVLTEWFNVTGGVDASPDWQHMHVEFIREGYAWVGVSAQAAGVAQLTCPTAGPGCRAAGDPVRYDSLMHPGNSYAYDIFSQAGQAIRDQSDSVLGGLQPQRVIAAGESQSAIYLTTYINGVHPVADVYDAFVVHSRFAGGGPLTQTPLERVATPNPTFIRDDLTDPVMVFGNENDSGSVAARQDDGPLYRLWEVTGTAHFDQYGLVQAQDDKGDAETVTEWFETMRSPTADPSAGFSCAVPINTGPATFVMRALLRSMNTWLVDGTPAPNAERFETVSLSPLVYKKDELGNVLGGIRTPAVDAPIALINGNGQPLGGTGVFCFLFGITIPFTDEQLIDRYQTHESFVSQWNTATQAAVEAGFILSEDAEDLKAAAEQSTILR
ncbi:MAG: hypothetical protein ACI9JM_003079 [Halioglobus sp.]|jgi:hypothetical protein